MDTFLHILIIGFAVGYVTELAGDLLIDYVDARILKQSATLPLAFGGLLLFGYFDWTLVVTAPAAGFVALAIMKIVNRPVILQSVAQRRI